jgi:plastocyanin domain-containing protein
VYVADPAHSGRFIEREVAVGGTSGDHVEIVSGLQPDDSVVVTGSFALRAERERLGLRTPSQGTSVPPGAQITRIVVSDKGFAPDRVTLRAGVAARLSFLRTTDATCATEVVVPSLKIRRKLPLNEPVLIEFTPDKAGEIGFACGMGMFHGTIFVQ